jgi:hypothetical protein
MRFTEPVSPRPILSRGTVQLSEFMMRAHAEEEEASKKVEITPIRARRSSSRARRPNPKRV